MKTSKSEFKTYSEFLRYIASLIRTPDELYDMRFTAKDGYFYSSWICNTIFGRTDPYSKKLRATIKRKIDTKSRKGSIQTFTTLFIKSFNEEENKQFRINWLLTLAAIHESKGN